MLKEEMGMNSKVAGIYGLKIKGWKPQRQTDEKYLSVIREYPVDISDFRLNETYDVEAHEMAAEWARNECELTGSRGYLLTSYHVEPFCSEVTLHALQTYTPLRSVRTDKLELITVGLGGGFSGLGEVCGTVVGHIIAIGLDVVSRMLVRDAGQVRLVVGMATREFCQAFQEKFGSLCCRDLIGLDLRIRGTYDKFVREEQWKVAKCRQQARFSILYPLPSEQG